VALLRRLSCLFARDDVLPVFNSEARLVGLRSAFDFHGRRIVARVSDEVDRLLDGETVAILQHYDSIASQGMEMCWEASPPGK
jgi:hypothetical protein